MPKRRTHRYVGSRRDPEEVAVSVFKDSCLHLIDRVHQTHEEIVLTKYGRPVAKLVAFEGVKAPVFGHLAGTVTIHGDVVAPVDVDWDAEG